MPDKPFTASAIVRNIFIDGSMIGFVEPKLIYARDVWKKIDFDVIIKKPGTHEIRVGNLKSVVIVKDEG